MLRIITVATALLAFISTASAELIISEIMYNPSSPEDNWEWVEIHNSSGSDVDLSGYVFDDENSVAHLASNITSGAVAAGGFAVLYNADDISAADFAAAWGPGINLIAVTNWSASAMNNGGDKISLWTDFASYAGDNETHANALVTVDYTDDPPFPADNGSASIYLTDLAADAGNGANWALSTDGVDGAFTSAAAAGNTGQDVGSPVPEPTSLVLLGLAGLILARRR